MQPILIQSPDKARAEIYPYGAHVTSWQTPDGAEQLYLSDHSEFRAGKAIRGGIPIIFPQFDSLGPLPRHGFARTTAWEYLGTTNTADTAQAAFRLTASKATRAIWNYNFQVEYHVRIGGNTLSLELDVLNTGTTPFSFTAALHTYVRVDDIANTQILGLHNFSYRDKTRSDKIFTQESEILTITAETDRVYELTPSLLTRRDNTRALQIEKRGFSDIVIWNPYDKAKSLSDLTPNGERHFICIEAATVANSITLQPSAHWQGAQIQNLTANNR